MTLRQPNIERMLQLGLSGMAEALEEQRDIADVEQLGFDDRLAMMLEREAQHRDHKSYLGHLRQAQLRIRADVQDVDCRAGRGIARTTLTQLAAGDWIRQALNLIVEGPTGSGKTFVACALAHQACRQKQPVLYRRVPELVAALNALQHDQGSLTLASGWPPASPLKPITEEPHNKPGREAPRRPIRAIRSSRNRGQITQESRSSVPGTAVKYARIRSHCLKVVDRFRRTCGGRKS